MGTPSTTPMPIAAAAGAAGVTAMDHYNHSIRDRNEALLPQREEAPAADSTARCMTFCWFVARHREQLRREAAAEAERMRAEAAAAAEAARLARASFNLD